MSNRRPISWSMGVGDSLEKDIAALRAEVAELRNCAVLSDQENDRLNRLNARLRDELVGMEEQRNALRAENAEQRKWFEGQREVVRLLKEENERLRTENESATKYLRTIGEELVIAGFSGGDRDVTLANLRAIIRERATLRELVREAYDCPDSRRDDWWERAEKALATTSPPPR